MWKCFNSWLNSLAWSRPKKSGSEQLLPAQVFVSYAHEDLKKVQMIVTYLRGHDLCVWYTPEDLKPGTGLSLVFQYIEKAQSFVVMLSKVSRNSPWVRREIDTAMALQLEGRALQIVPVLLEPVELPVQLKSLLGIDLSGSRYDIGLERLTDTLKGRDRGLFDVTEVVRRFAEELPVVPDHLADREFSTLVYQYFYTELFSGSEAAIGTKKYAIDHIRRTSIADEIKENAVSVIEQRRMPEVIGEKALSELPKWLRQADAELLALASFLYDSWLGQWNNMQPAIQQAFIEKLVRDWSRTKDLPISEQDQISLYTQDLIRRAQRTALLGVQSQRSPRNSANNSDRIFKLGSAVRTVGSVAYRFEMKQVREFKFSVGMLSRFS